MSFQLINRGATETFRPLAPSALAEQARNHFDLDGDSPHMLFTASTNEAKRHAPKAQAKAALGPEKLCRTCPDIPAVNHIGDGTRVQTVHAVSSPDFHALRSAIHELTGCPALTNSCLHVRGEQNVCMPEDPSHCVMGAGLDMQVIGNLVLIMAKPRF